MVQIDAGIEDGDGLALPIDASEPQARAKLIEMNERSILLRKKLDSAGVERADLAQAIRRRADLAERSRDGASGAVWIGGVE
jgi:hypothetical protein